MSTTLLLNQNYEPISVLPLSVINWQHAIKLMYLGRVHVLETYPDWIIHSEKLAINVPSVCVTKDYFHYKQHVKFSRYNLYLRDLFKCQYCDDVYDYDELTIDHVVPRMVGGKSTWENCVTSCNKTFANGRPDNQENTCYCRTNYIWNTTETNCVFNCTSLHLSR